MDLYHPLLKAAFAGVAGMAITYLLHRSTSGAARADGAAMVVEYGRPMKFFVITSWLVFGGVAAAAALAGWSARTGGLWAAGVFFLLVIFLHLETFGVRIRYDPEGLHVDSPWRKARFVPWSAITEVRYSMVNKWHVLFTNGCGKVRLPLLLTGGESLLDELSRRGVAVPGRE